MSKIESAATNFKVQTPTAVIGVRGTEFICNVDKDGKTDVVTIEGLVSMKPYIPGKEKEKKESGSKKEKKEEKKGGEKSSGATKSDGSGAKGKSDGGEGSSEMKAAKHLQARQGKAGETPPRPRRPWSP